MKEFAFLTSLIFISTIVISQTVNDTIDYSTIDYYNETRPIYIIDKITSGPKSEILKVSYSSNMGGGFMVYSVNHADYKKTFSCFKNNANYKTSDTIVYLEFDMEKYDKPFQIHQWGIMHFHKNNIITIDKVREGAYMRREFKVLKWTKTEIILKDNSLKYLNRTYYLRKFYK